MWEDQTAWLFRGRGCGLGSKDPARAASLAGGHLGWKDGPGEGHCLWEAGMFSKQPGPSHILTKALCRDSLQSPSCLSVHTDPGVPKGLTDAMREA